MLNLFRLPVSVGCVKLLVGIVQECIRWNGSVLEMIPESAWGATVDLSIEALSWDISELSFVKAILGTDHSEWVRC